MGETPSSSAPAQLPGLTIEAVEWLPSGADSGLVRVRGRWSAAEAARPGLPLLVVRARGAEHRFESLPDARFARDPASWRGSYLVPAALVAAEPDALWVEWPGGVRAGLPALAPGLANVPVPAVAPADEEPAGGQLIDREVLAERRARRAEAAEQAQARIAAEALRAVEALELQSAELERRLADATDDSGASAPSSGHEEALASALGSLARLRAQSREWRLRLRTSEIAHAGDAVRLAVLEVDRRSATAAVHDARERRARDAAELAAAADATTRARAELAAARAEAEQARTALEEAREQADARVADALTAAERERAEIIRREQAAQKDVRDALEARIGELGEKVVELEAARSELAAGHDSAEARATELRARVADLEAALTVTETRLHAAEAAAKTTEAGLRVESVARAVLEDELDRERATRNADLEAATAERDALAAELESRASESAALIGDLEAAIAERDALADELDARVAALTAERDAVAAERDGLAERLADEAELVALTAERDALARDLRTERDAAALLAAELRDALAGGDREAVAGRLEARLAAARESIAVMDRQLDGERRARAQAEAAVAATRSEGGALQARIAELDRRAAGLADEVRLEQAARAQAEAAAAAVRPPTEQSGRMVADLAAAAAALRRSAPAEDADQTAPDDPVESRRESVEPAAGAADEIAGDEPAAVEPVAAGDEPAAVAAGDETAAVPAAAAPAERTRPTIVSAPGQPPRTIVLGSAARHYPPLRGALVKLAHDDPVAAGQLLVALLPAQAAALANALDYDLTVEEVGTFAVTVADGSTTVSPLDKPRGRRRAAFHLSADALTLAELLAGVDRRVGRFFGPARYSGSRRRLNVLRALPGTRLTLAEAARAGAALDPGHVFRALAYAVHPSWTRGDAFTVAQEILGEPPQTWYLTARDNGGLAVTNQPPALAPDATVSMTPETFDLLLRGLPVPSGVRPIVRGDQEAVARVKAWTDRAQGIDGA